jgi:Glycosyl hydrolase family 9
MLAQLEQVAHLAAVLTARCSRYFEDVASPQGDCTVFEDSANGICYKSANRNNLFQTHGALVGGPKTPTDAGDPNRIPYSDEGYNDWRTDYIASEEALDYNALVTLALAASVELPSDFWTSPCGADL